MKFRLLINLTMKVLCPSSTLTHVLFLKIMIKQILILMLYLLVNEELLKNNSPRNDINLTNYSCQLSSTESSADGTLL